MFQNYLRVIVLSVLATYLLSLAAGVYADPVFSYFYSHPVKWFDLRRQMELSHQDVEEGVRKNLRFFNFQRDNGKGVVSWETGGTYGDYTFFFSTFDEKAYLVNFQGKIIHEWNLDPASLSLGIAHPWYPDVVWRAFLQPNGDILAMYCGVLPNATEYEAKGMFRVDKDSKLIWDHPGRIHHDAMVLPDGTTVALLAVPGYEPYPAAPSLQPPFARDFLVMLDNRGREIKRISILDMFASAPQKKFLQQLGTIDSPRLPNGDLFHTNAISPVTAAAAARNPALKAGDILLSFRNFDLLATANLDRKTITWASYGVWHGQHGTVFLPDGSLMMFDNLGHLNSPGDMSRVLNVDTATGEVLWEYAGDNSSPVFSLYNSSVDPLPNGNVLVTETGAGRIFEVTRGKRVVWDYRAPQRIKSSKGALLIPNLSGGKRYRKEDLPFLDGSAVH